MISNSARPSTAPTTPTAPVPIVSSTTHGNVCYERVTPARRPARPGYAAVQA